MYHPSVLGRCWLGVSKGIPPPVVRNLIRAVTVVARSVCGIQTVQKPLFCTSARSSVPRTVTVTESLTVYTSWLETRQFDFVHTSQLSLVYLLPHNAVRRRGASCRPVSVRPSVRHTRVLYQTATDIIRCFFSAIILLL